MRGISVSGLVSGLVTGLAATLLAALLAASLSACAPGGDASSSSPAETGASAASVAPVAPSDQASPAVPTAPADPLTADWPALDEAGLQRLVHSRIFFGHRSVGSEIVEFGVPAVFASFGLDPPGPGGPDADGSFDDTWLVQTDDPSDKMADFERIVRDGIGESADIAFMKLGFVDILEDTDIEAVFEEYRAMMAALEADYPDTVFLHVTVTVTRWNAANNLAIQHYNDLLRAQYGATGRLIDLATVVSTCPDGTPDIVELDDGQTYQQLCLAYDRDGGHLNEVGDEAAARVLLQALAAFA